MGARSLLALGCPTRRRLARPRRAPRRRPSRCPAARAADPRAARQPDGGRRRGRGGDHGRPRHRHEPRRRQRRRRPRACRAGPPGDRLVGSRRPHAARRRALPRPRRARSRSRGPADRRGPLMTLTPTRTILDEAYAAGRGVGAFNVMHLETAEALDRRRGGGGSAGDPPDLGELHPLPRRVRTHRAGNTRRGGGIVGLRRRAPRPRRGSRARARRPSTSASAP